MDGRVAFATVERLILDFFLSKHEKYLSRVRDIFHSLDPDDDGVIGPAQFIEALSFVDPMDELRLSSDDLLQIADPGRTGSITFSRFVEVLSGVKVRNGRGEEVSLIQFSRLLH